MAGTDWVPIPELAQGLASHLELEFLAEAGIPPLDVLRFRPFYSAYARPWRRSSLPPSVPAVTARGPVTRVDR